MYSITRVLLTLVCILTAVIIYLVIFKKKQGAAHKVILLIVTVVVCLVWVFPIENMFFRFAGPKESFYYSHFGAKLINTIPYDNGSVVVYYENDSNCIDVLVKDSDGYKINSPYVKTLDSMRNDLPGFVLVSKRIPNSPLTFVCVVYAKFDDPKLNVDKIRIESISDSNDSLFELFEYRIYNGFRQICYYSFTNANDPDYSVFVNGNQYTLR